MKFLNLLTLLFLFLIFNTFPLLSADLQLEKIGRPTIKEFPDYRPETIEPVIDSLHVFVSYSDEYRPLGLTIQKMNVSIGEKRITGYQVTSYYSSKAKPDVSNYTPNMKLLFKPKKIEKFNFYQVMNNSLVLVKKFTKSDFKDGYFSFENCLPLQANGGPSKQNEYPTFVIVPETEVAELESLLTPENLRFEDISVSDPPFDIEQQEQISPTQHDYLYKFPPHINILYHNSTYHICWHNASNNKLTITRKTSDGKILKPLSFPMPFPKFGGCTIDEDGNYYVLYAKNNADGNFEPNIKLVKYNSDGKEIGSFQPKIDRSSYDVMKPITNTCKIAYGNQKVAIHMGKFQHKNKADGLNHQSAIFIVVNSKTMTEDKALSTNWIASHSFDQRLIFDGQDFVSLDLADGAPRGFSMSKQKSSRVIFTYKTKHYPDGKSSNDNNTYSDLGGIANTEDGYLVAGSSEKSFSNAQAETYLNDARNLFVLKVAKDFHTKPETKINNKVQKHIVSPEVVISKGEDSEENGFYDYWRNYNQQKRIGIIWLTNYSNLNTENAIRPKIISKNSNEFVLLWEKWSKDNYLATYYMVVDRNGNIIKKAANLGSVARLPNLDEPISVDGKIVWVIGKKDDKKLRIFTLDP